MGIAFAASRHSLRIEEITMRIFLTLMIVIPVTDFAAIYGDQAERLNLPTAKFTLYAPLLMLLGYWSCRLLLREGRMSRYRIEIATAIGAFFAAYPLLLLGAFSVSLPLKRDLSSDEKGHLYAVVPHPFVVCFEDGGEKLRIWRTDRSEALIKFLASIHAT